MCVRESERDLLPNKETTTNFDAPKMSFECLKRERRMISVGWFGSSKILRLKSCNFSQDLTFVCFKPLVLCHQNGTKQSILQG